MGTIKELLDSCKSKVEALERLGLKQNGSGWRTLKKTCEEIGYDETSLLSRKTPEIYLRDPKYCTTCEKQLPWGNRNGKFCSHSCSAASSNVIRGQKAGKRLKTCLNCNNVLFKKHSFKYCNSKCAQTYKTTLKIEKWKKGEWYGGTLTGISRVVRNYLFLKYSNKCMKCSWGEIHPITNRIPLEVHHIDGNSNNHNEDNLELLCPNCHSLTYNFGFLNNGNSQRKKYERQKRKNNDLN